MTIYFFVILKMLLQIKLVVVVVVLAVRDIREGYSGVIMLSTALSLFDIFENFLVKFPAMLPV